MKPHRHVVIMRRLWGSAHCAGTHCQSAVPWVPLPPGQWAAVYPGKEPRSTREAKVKSAHRGDLVLDKAPRHLASRPPASDLPLLTLALLPNHLLGSLSLLLASSIKGRNCPLRLCEVVGQHVDGPDRGLVAWDNGNNNQ